MGEKDRSCESLEWERKNLPSVKHSARVAIAVTVPFIVARLFLLPEAYWAVIATLVVMLSRLGATLIISVERIAATALGALVGALLATYFTGNVFAFAAAVFVIGIVCIALRMEKLPIVRLTFLRMPGVNR
jgi:uncharacterized membrane protein YccC